MKSWPSALPIENGEWLITIWIKISNVSIFSSLIAKIHDAFNFLTHFFWTILKLWWCLRTLFTKSKHKPNMSGPQVVHKKLDSQHTFEISILWWADLRSFLSTLEFLVEGILVLGFSKLEFLWISKHRVFHCIWQNSKQLRGFFFSQKWKICRRPKYVYTIM